MATIIKATGEEVEIPAPDWRRLQEIIGGTFCLATLPDGRAMYAHDEGLLLGLPANPKATALYDNPSWPIVGDVVVLNRRETAADRRRL